jgi:hypothetical protein
VNHAAGNEISQTAPADAGRAGGRQVEIDAGHWGENADTEAGGRKPIQRGGEQFRLLVEYEI